MDVALSVVWWSMIGATILLFLACAVIPAFLVRWQSMPWAFHLSRNLDVSLQSVMYAATHRHWFSQGCHATLPLEQVAWGVILITGSASTVGAMGAGVVLFCVGVQVWHIGTPRQGLLLVAAWALLLGLAVAWLALDSAAVVEAQWALLGLSLLRTVSHAVEPLPPGIAEANDTFVPLDRARLSLPKLVALGVIGWVSEFASGLPFRLFVVQVAWFGERTGLAPGVGWKSAVQAADAIHARGWRAHPVLHGIFAGVLRLTIPLASEKPAASRVRARLVRRRPRVLVKADPSTS